MRQRRRLAAAGLADQAQRFAFADGEADPSTARTWSTVRSISRPFLTGKCLRRSVTSSRASRRRATYSRRLLQADLPSTWRSPLILGVQPAAIAVPG